MPSLAGCIVKDYGNLIFKEVSNDHPFGTTKQPRAVGLANKQVADAVQRVKNDSYTCVMLGGDHRFNMFINCKKDTLFINHLNNSLGLL